MVEQKIKEEFYQRQKRLNVPFLIMAIAGLLLLLNDKAFGKIKIIEYGSIIFGVIAINWLIIKIMVLGFFSIKNKIAFLTPGMGLFGQEHYGWQAVITGIVYIIISLFFIGLEIFILITSF